jgi:curli biogenesis system outer membrane secretion channel CsgG
MKMGRGIRWWAVGLVVVVVAVLPAAPGHGQAPRKGVMVIDFEDLARGWSYTREVVTVRVVSKLREDPALRVVPRERVQDALREARLDPAGYVDWEAAQRVAKSLEADYVVMGQVATFDQQYTGGCLPIVGCAYTWTATVTLRGKVLDAAAGTFVLEPRSDGKKSQTSVSLWVGPWWSSMTVNNFDGQLIGKATQEAVEDFVAKVKPYLK